MTFEKYIHNAWAIHGEQPALVAEGFADAAKSAETPAQLLQFVGLATHVMGEHLANWEEGLRLLESLKVHSAFAVGAEVDFAIRRSVGVMQLGQGRTLEDSHFSLSDRVRILAMAASAFAPFETARSESFLLEALELARRGLDKVDPANRALAITGNNLAIAIEEKATRTTAETALMILAAHAGLEFWGIAGTWLETSRAEYRLAMSYLKAQQLPFAFTHAQKCLEICLENQAGAFELFFAYEAIAKIHLAELKFTNARQAIDKCAEQIPHLDQNDRDYCEPILKSLEASLKA